MTLKAQWVDFKREPQCEPDPAYPDGKNINMAGIARRACGIELPYPAPRCGFYLVTCDDCQKSITITTAGRRDDPRSLIVPCNAQ